MNIYYDDYTDDMTVQETLSALLELSVPMGKPVADFVATIEATSNSEVAERELDRLIAYLNGITAAADFHKDTKLASLTRELALAFVWADLRD